MDNYILTGTSPLSAGAGGFGVSPCQCMMRLAILKVYRAPCGYSYWPNIFEAYFGLKNFTTHFSQ